MQSTELLFLVIKGRQHTYFNNKCHWQVKRSLESFAFMMSLTPKVSPKRDVTSTKTVLRWHVWISTQIEWDRTSETMWHYFTCWSFKFHNDDCDRSSYTEVRSDLTRSNTAEKYVWANICTIAFTLQTRLCFCTALCICCRLIVLIMQ